MYFSHQDNSYLSLILFIHMKNDVDYTSVLVQTRAFQLRAWKMIDSFVTQATFNFSHCGALYTAE